MYTVSAQIRFPAFSIRQFIRAILLCSKDAVPCITQTWTDIGILIQAAVQMAHIDLDIGMGCTETLQAFRRSNDGHKLDLFPAVLLDEINGSHAGTSGSQHGISDNDGALLNGVGKLAVILMRLMGDFIAVQSNMAYLCAGNQCKDAVHHAQPCTEDRNHSQLASAEYLIQSFVLKK